MKKRIDVKKCIKKTVSVMTLAALEGESNVDVLYSVWGLWQADTY